VPVTVTVKVPLVVAVHERIEVPKPATLVGLSVQVIPLRLIVLVRLTAPVNPLTAVIVIVEGPAWLTFTATLVGLAAIAKSCTT
jgi:hypothetical protein